LESSSTSEDNNEKYPSLEEVINDLESFYGIKENKKKIYEENSKRIQDNLN